MAPPFVNVKLEADVKLEPDVIEAEEISLENFIKTEITEYSPNFKCSVCDFSTENKDELKKHEIGKIL